MKIVLAVLLVAVAGVGAWFVPAKFPRPIAGAGGNQILYYTCPMHPSVHSATPGKCPECGMNLVPVYATNALVTATSPAKSAGRKILYYQSAMHPWIKSDKPGKCPICGMDLVPVYEGDAGAANLPPDMVKLNPDSISVINVQTDVVTNRPIRRTIVFSGDITAQTWTLEWFEFTAYQRDLPWLKADQKLEVTVPGVSDKTYEAQIKVRSLRPFIEPEFDPMTASATVRAEILNAPVEVGDLTKYKLRLPDKIYAEGRLIAETENVLAIPRRAIISRGQGDYVFVDKGGGYYQLRPILLGRIGDDFAEVRANLDAGETVVTTGNVLIDSEAQLAGGD